MNERDTFYGNYRIDNSNNKQPSQEAAYRINQNSGLSKTKIININDFIFRQYLEFYPELQGLSCKDNILYLTENGEIITNEALTFDLRTLPGEVWNVDAKTFMEIIKINKSCKSLEDFINLLQDNTITDPNALNEEVTNEMNLYFSIKDSFSYLTEDNKMLIGMVENMIATLPKESELGTLVNQKLNEYFEITKELGDSKGKGMVLELKNKNVPAIIEEEPITRSSKAAFVNIAIIIYGVLNIGFILAIALMK